MGMGVGGFSADKAGIEGLAQFSHDRADDVRGCLDGLRGLPEANEDLLGDTGALDAYLNFFGAWTDELSIVAGGLDETGSKFRQTADAYHTTDVHWGHTFQPVTD